MEILLFLLTLLVIAVPICAFLALSQSNKALREIEELRERLRKLSLNYSSPKDNELKEIS